MVDTLLLDMGWEGGGPSTASGSASASSSALGSLVVVQLEYLQNGRAEGGTPPHPWPMDFAGPNKRQMSAVVGGGGGSNIMGMHNNDDNVTSYKGVSQQQLLDLQESTGGEVSDVLSYKEWMQIQLQQQQQQQQVAMQLTGGDSNVLIYEEWLQTQQQEWSGLGRAVAAQVASYKSTRGNRMDKTYGASMLSSLPYSSTSSPIEDLDIVSGTHIVLHLLTGESINATVVNPNVYYYNPTALKVQQSVLDGGGGEEGAEEEAVVTTTKLTLPGIVYDASGTPYKMDSVHAGGRNEVYLEVKPCAVWGSTRGGGWGCRWCIKGQWNSIRDELTSATLLSSSLSYLSQDQLIVFFTVVTMAIMISALLACRLRTRNMLDECMHHDLDDDDLDLDTDSFSSV